MLGDGTCHSICLSAACDFDRGDCDASLCSAGCYPFLIENGHCDEVCNAWSCEWDGGDCSPGCTPDLLANDECDPACNTAEYGWDGMHCGCAPGCSFSDLGDCKRQCLVLDCNYDDFAGFPACPDANLRRAIKAYKLAIFLLGAGDDGSSFDFAELCTQVKNCADLGSTLIASVGCLFDECRSEDCSFLYWDCSVLPNCIAALWARNKYQCAECTAPLKNSFGECGEGCAPGLVPHPSGLCILEEDSTTEDNPLKVYVSANYTQPDADGSETRPFPLISQALKHANKHYSMVVLMDHTNILGVEVESAILSYGSPSLTPFDNQWVVWILPYGCLFASSCERAQVEVPVPAVLMPPGYRDSTYYCSEDNPAGELRIFHIDFLKSTGGDLLIDAHTGSLTLRNVTFKGFIGIQSIISLSFDNTVLLENVDFVHVCCSDACIMQFSDGCERKPLSTLVYRGGAVSIAVVNYGQEFFLQMQDMLSVTIESITFVGSVGYSSSTAFITFDSCCLFVLEDCVFANNTMGARSAIAVEATYWTFSNSKKKALIAEYSNVTNIVIRRVSFYNNSYTTGSGLYFSFPKIAQRVEIADCSFDSDVSQSSLIAAVASREQWIMNLRGPVFYPAFFSRVEFPPPYFRLKNILINDCIISSPAIFIENLAHIEIVQVHTRMLAGIDCAPLMWINASHDVTMKEIYLADIQCERGNPGLHFIQTTGNITLSLIFFAEIQAEVLLFVEAAWSLQMSDSSVLGCSSVQGLGGVQLQGDFTATLSNVTFHSNFATNGGALSISAALQIALVRCTFRNNSATSGGAILVSPQAGTRVDVVDCDFVGNSALLTGGAIYVQYTPPKSSLKLSIRSSNFTQNRANKCAGVCVNNINGVIGCQQRLIRLLRFNR